MSARELIRDLQFALGVIRRRPFHCLIQVTNRCNMTCGFCDFWPNGVPAHQELSLDDYRRLEEQLTGLGRFMISIEGGEPLLRPDLVEIVRILSQRHVTILYTNGWHVTESLAAELFAAGLTQAGVSIDFADAARHDTQRGLTGACERAWRAVASLRDTAPHAGRQVHVMTVFMRDNVDDLERLLQQSAERKVGHCITLLSKHGYRRAGGEWPDRPVSAHLVELWQRYPHFRLFREYLDRFDAFLAGESLPTCRAGVQSFNIDHLGNVSPCIEKIDQPVGNVRKESLRSLHQRLVEVDAGHNCQKCWTACRGVNQTLGGGGSLSGWWDLASRMRSV